MKIQVWENRNFSNKNPINYPCPKCYLGFLTRKNIVTEITPAGKDMEYFNYHGGIEHVFSGILICNNTECNELVSISGKCLKDIVYGRELPNGEMVEERFSTYYPKYFYPNLKLFSLGEEIPKLVSEQINLAFSHYFSDLSSCANRIRNSIELILDDIKAPISAKNKQGNVYSFTTLHQRIEHFGKRKSRISKLLLALKIIGNEGSHIGEINQGDILDAFEILEELLESTYTNQRKRVAKIAQEIVIKNKPRSK
jgi:hypothetical protein